MKQPTHFLIDADLVRELRAYLGTRPFDEVAALIVGGRNGVTGQAITGILQLVPAPEPPEKPAESNGAAGAKPTADEAQPQPETASAN